MILFMSTYFFSTFTVHYQCITLLRSGSEWPKDQAQLLMHSRYARNLYDSKIKRVFEIALADFEIILFIHLNKHFDGARGTL